MLRHERSLSPRSSPGAETTPPGQCKGSSKRAASEPGWHPAPCRGCAIWAPGLTKIPAYSPGTPERASSA